MKTPRIGTDNRQSGPDQAEAEAGEGGNISSWTKEEGGVESEMENGVNLLDHESDDESDHESDEE